MKFLVDECFSDALADGLRRNGFEATHVWDQGLRGRPDEEIAERARQLGMVVVTLDHDYGALLALSGARSPSVIRLVHSKLSRPGRQLFVLLAALPELAGHLEAGCIATLDGETTRVRPLPIRRES